MGLSLGGGHRQRVDVDRSYLGLLDVRRRKGSKNAPDGAGYVALGELRGGQLIEEGLELVIVVPVDQRDPNTSFGQILGAGHAGKAARRRPRPRCPDSAVSSWRLDHLPG